MQGLMMDVPLTITSIIRHAERVHGQKEIVSVTRDNPRHRYTYRDAFQRSRQLASAIAGWNLGRGDRIATLAWNDYRHLEAYYAAACSGYVCHTINPRLFPEQIVYIINHARDRFLLIDQDFVDTVAQLVDQLTSVEQFIILGSAGCVQVPPELGEVLFYDDLIASESTSIDWPELDERAASGLCYTSGTTGHPKGVLYSHRSTVLHSMAIAQPDNLSLSALDTVMPAAPLYHAQSWGLPYGACMVGSKFVLPGRHLDGQHLLELICDEGVTTGCGVPTVWSLVLEYAEQNDLNLGQLERLLIGGTALPTNIRDRLKVRGVAAVQIWGMTETSPMGTIGRVNRLSSAMLPDEKEQLLLKQGRLPYGVQMRVKLPDGSEAPRDGQSAGDLWVKGPWIASGYLHGDGGAMLDADGFFPTGDVGHIDALGFMKITDRSKDVIKSGGEWISSIDIEDIAANHPAVALAAVVAAYHPRWDERPLLFITLNAGASISESDMLAFLEGKIAKWWTPNAVLIIDEMPMTATGKIRKLTLRERYWRHLAADEQSH